MNGALMPQYRIVISGCSGGGKSTLLAELAQRGYGVVEEPGRRIVVDEAVRPEADMEAFLRRCFALACEDFERMRPVKAPVFFDRSALDARAGLARLGLVAAARGPAYYNIVFLTPPWRDIFVQDQERRHGFEAGLAEYHALVDGLPEYGYEVRVIPKVPVAARADFLLAALGL
jgi:predicted ATPase